MAEYLGYTEKAQKYAEIYEKGRAWTNEHLFNGRYFAQKIDLYDKSITDHFKCSERYWNEEAGQIKYQIGDGCAIDQLCGQWHANIIGLGRIFDKDKTDVALKNLYQNNFFTNMRTFDNPWRIFALNDDAGAVICTYPKGAEKPIIPVPYCEEAMNGFEYQLAGLLMSEGFIEEGLEIVRGVQKKYNGANRNPFGEMECGSNYARSMASFALLPILSGFSFDLPHGRIGFDPKVKGEEFRSFFAVAAGWGEICVKEHHFTLEMKGGELEISSLHLPFMEKITQLEIDGKESAYGFEEGILYFDSCKVLGKIEIK